MGRESYDDMVGPDRPRSKGKSSGRVGLIALFGVLICAIGVLLYLIFVPPEETEPEAVGQTPVTVEVKEPEIIAPAAVTEISGSTETTATTDGTSSSDIPASDLAPAAETSSAEVSAETIRPAASTSSSVQTQGRTTAVDLVTAQTQASFSTSDRLVYITRVVQEGETLQSIADAYGLKVGTLISVNKIRNLAAVTAGVSIQVPNMDGQLYTVREGDMLSTIAYRYNPQLGWQRLMEVNNLKTENIRVGQELFIPDVEEEETVSISEGALTFTQPVPGTISRSYGSLFEGVPLTGVIISGSAGSAVVASQDGVVVDAGNSPTLGRFIVIQHGQGYKTSYAYLETVVAKVGGEVKAGDVIGTIGTSGATSTPSLFFQIEQGGITLDPEMFI